MRIRDLVAVGTIVLGLVSACSSEDRRTEPPAGIMCGEARCAGGETCCIDCDGRGLCGPPGTACAGFACFVDSGGGDAGEGISCGGTRCAAGQVCCIDCDGRGNCGPPGSSCAGTACLDSGTASACGASTCPDETDPAHACGDSGGACGANDQPCCEGACTAGLMCCSGVPYPPDGVCYTDCPAVSDRAMKEGFEEVDPSSVLERVAQMPVTRWSYRAEPGVRHMGPMAQDFSAAFGLGASDRRIEFVDANGVLIAAIQGLEREMRRVRDDNRALRRDNAAMRRELERLERRIAR